MTQQIINTGTVANDGTGDPLRMAFGKANANFAELYGAGFVTSAALSGYATTSSVTTAISTAVFGLQTSGQVAAAVIAAVAGLSAVARTGFYADLTGAPAAYSLPVASGSVLGGVKAGAGVTIAADGTVSATGTSGVATFNARAGAVTLTLGDVTTALGFAPYSVANPVGYQTAAQVTAAVQAVVGAAPAALATLAAIDAQLANDESAAAALTTAVAGKLSKSANLSDLASAPAARTALGLATVASSGSYGDLTGAPAPFTLSTASTSVLGGVKVDGTTVTVSGGVISAVGGGTASTAFVRSVYTASGAILTANTLAVLNGSTGTLAMTLANGTADGQPILIKQLGTAGATVTGSIDGASQSVALAAGTSGTVRDALKLRWSVADTSWLAE